MSLADNNSVHSLARSFSSESKSLKASRTQVKLNEHIHQKLRETPTSTLTQNYTKVNLRNRIVLAKNNELANHKRTISEVINKNSAYPFDLNIFEKFLKKLEIEKTIESQVLLLIEFLDEARKSYRLFSEVFAKIHEIVKSYQKHVKSLDSTRIGDQDLSFEVKNKSLKQVPGKVVKFKLLAEKNDIEDSMFSSNISGVSQIPLKSFPKNSRFSIKNFKLVTKPDLSSAEIPRLSSKERKIPGLVLSTTGKVDFHEEFMQKIDEFSESWRQEAMKLKK